MKDARMPVKMKIKTMVIAFAKIPISVIFEQL
jgi:hypothetical protein